MAGVDEPFDELSAGEVGEVLVAHGFFPEYRNKPTAPPTPADLV